MRFAKTLIFTVVIAASLTFIGCDDAFIDPFSNDGKYFTVYGFLDQSRNFEGASHAIRVVPVTRQLARIVDPSSPRASIDARVFTIDLALDQVVEWDHTLEKMEDGTYGHIFSSRLFIQPNHTYRLEVRRSDGIVAYAETRVPTVSSIVPERGTPRFEPATPESSFAEIMQDITLPGAKSVWSIDVIYHTGGGACMGSSPQAIPYGRAGASTSTGWKFTANISEDVATLTERLGTANFTVCAMGVRAKILDKNWAFPEGELDLEMLANPNALTNVVNGYGFFGSIALLLYDWPISDELAALLE